MTKQIPQGPKDRFCPYNGKSMARVCHACPKWIQVKGQHPQNEKEEIDQWDCADAWTPIMLTQIIRGQHAIQKAVESRGNDTIKMVAEGIMRQERQHNEALGHMSSARTPIQIAHAPIHAEDGQMDLIDHIASKTNGAHN